MKGVRTHAIVLRRTNYGEADRIIQFLTPHGRKTAIARGVRREKSRLAGGIELFAICDVVIAEGRGDMGIVTSARLVNFFGAILQDFDRMQFGYDILKLAARGSEAVDEPEWYDAVAEALNGLNSGKISDELVRLWFYVRFANLSGNGLNLQSDTAGRPLRPDGRYGYDSYDQGFVLRDAGELGSDHIKFLRLVAAKPLVVVTQVGGATIVLPQCLMILRQHLNV